MPIYSANRMGSMPVVEAAKGYGPEDIGRILYESEVNSQKIFEAALAADFAEIKARREGTMLESELTAMNEASMSAFVSKIKATLEHWWRKLKGAIKSTIDKIAAYVLGDGKKFATEFEAQWKAKGKDFEKKLQQSGEEIEYKELKQGANVDKKDFPTTTNFTDLIKSSTSESIDKTEKIKELLGGKTPSEYREAVLSEDKWETKKIKNYNDADNYQKEAVATVRGAKKEIEDLRKNEKICNDIVSSIGKDLKYIESDKGSAANEVYMKNISTLVSVYQTVCSLITTTNVKIVKMRLKIARTVLGKILAICNRKVEHSSADIRFMVEAAAEEFDMAFDNAEGVSDEDLAALEGEE